MKTTNRSLAAFAISLVLTFSGCGPESGSESSTQSKVSGTVSAGQAISVVSLKDSSAPAREASAIPDGDGAFTFDVAGLRAPYLLRARWTDDSGTHALYSVAQQGGTANVNAITDAAVTRAAGEDPDQAYERGDARQIAGSFGTVLEQFHEVLKPLFELYRVSNPATDSAGDSSGLRSMLRDVTFSVSDGTLTITNRETGGVVFAGPLSNLSSGTFHPENLPSGDGVPPTPATCSSFTYNAWTPSTCPSTGQQTRTVATSSPSGCTGGTPVLTQSCTYTPPTPATCSSFTYNAWTPSTCPSTAQQTRTVATSSPSGCTGGTPVLTQSCTYTPPTPATCSSFTYNAWTPSTCPSTGPAGAHRRDLLAVRLHRRDAGPHPVLHVHAADAGDLLRVHLLGLGRLLLRRHPDPDGDVLVALRLHRRGATVLTQSCTSRRRPARSRSPTRPGPPAPPAARRPGR